MTYAFEPSAPSYHDLCLNIRTNGCDEVVTPLPFALLAETRLVPFAHYSLEPGSSKHTFSFDRGRGDLELLYRQHAAALTLDDAVRLLGLRPPTHMKLDTETTELDVLEGAPETLALPSWRSILTETEDEDAVAAFRELLLWFGFRHVRTFARESKGAPPYSLFMRD
jgi:FkbM family methyltransferase